MLSPSEARVFFDHYHREFDKPDWEAFSLFFHEPFMTVRGDGSVYLLKTQSDTRQFFETVAAAWRREGYERFSTANFESMPLGKYGLLATFDWEMLRQDGSIMKRWRQSYQLIAVRQDWKVLASTFHAI
jgi:hypothetical protein